MFRSGHKMIETLVLRRQFDAAGFDADGVGDYYYVDTDWTEFNSEAELLKYLQDNTEDGRTGKLHGYKTVQKYVDDYGFQVFKRIY